MQQDAKRWSRNKPTEPGWYWWRHPLLTDPRIARLIIENGELKCLDDVGQLWEIIGDGEWQGPICPNEATE